MAGLASRPLLSALLSLILWSGFAMASHVAEEEALRLSGRSVVAGYQVELSDDDWHWLREKRFVRLGVSTPDYPPFDIVTNRNDYEGITADYAGLLGELLHLRMEARRFPSRKAAVEALERGEIDLLGTSSDFEAAEAGLVLSSPYVGDQPILASRIGEDLELSAGLAGMRVAMLDRYRSEQVLRAFYPKARLQRYPSTLSAMGAVAFGQADVYLGDAIGAGHLVDWSYLGNIRLENFARMKARGFSFALARGDSRLERLVNLALEAIPRSGRMSILQRWGADEVSIHNDQRLQLSAAEQRWLDRHPKVRVVVSRSLLPFTFLDERNRLSGISADVLDRISRRTGLEFEIGVAHSGPVERMIEAVVTGKADMLAAFTPSLERESQLSFTRPYFTNSFVLVTRDAPDSPLGLDDLAGKRIALIKGNLLREYLREHYPEIRIVDAADAEDAISMVAEGRVEASANMLIGARYIIAREYPGRLKIVSIVGNVPAQIAFATGRGSTELVSILNKALLSIPPTEMDALTNRWRSQVVVENGYWRRYRMAIILGFLGAAALLLIALGRDFCLRRQIRRRERAEQALNDQMAFMRVLIDGIPLPVYVRDRQGRLMACNPSYLDSLGVRDDRVLGKLAAENLLTDLEEAREYDALYQRVMEQGLSEAGDRRLTLASGEVLAIYHWARPYLGRDGSVQGVIAGWMDVSERQRLLDELREARDEAEAANRAKTTFLATMSHEIRTPMNAVIGMLELALKKAEQGVLDRFALDVASEAARGLLDLIGDILDIARIESGKLSLAPERANLRALVESTVRVFDGLARQKRIALVFDAAGEADRDVEVDPLHFKQVLSNLIGNAIKFTDQGEVRVAYRSRPQVDENSLSVRLEIVDTGHGISSEDQARLFSPFSQAGDNGMSARGGSGLGLVISRTLCEMMGGELHLSSEIGRGTRIEILLDLPLLEPLADEPLAPLGQVLEDGPPLDVLVVDDYPANRMLLAQQLGYLGHRVQDAGDGVDALRIWRLGRFDVVITDCNMPTMSGYELARAIREQERASGAPPCLLIGFTANALPEERQRCLDAGMDDCLFKPITLQDLQRRLAGMEPWAETDTEEGAGASAGMGLGHLQHLTRGDNEALKSLLGELARSNREDLIRLAGCAAKLDRRGLADLAHGVKGSARIVRDSRLAAACERLERACGPGHDSGELEAAVAELREAMQRLGELIDSHLD
ncbi:transporter substrate-binding domain-containing protein [Zestomonas carbonaria]|uniref:histidine kinase n=1 Tax=Zestomonas carbonaria TaxID=2762745 RepID=A0A7U7ESQ7_9GAMM|nr:transporter substrate-binding domain-containing protein [Pseudomonas carbonaria]CAD5110463.1 Virulence sensor protein BvgS [Pseudomonas carbonaria]